MKMLTLIVLFFLASFSNALEIGEVASDFEMTTVQGEYFKLSDFQGHKPVYLIFWATWCPICKKEVPHFKEIENTLGDEIKVLAINVGMDQTLEEVLEYKKRHGINYPIAFDEGSVISRRYGVLGTPWQVIIDINGVVQYRSSKTPKNLQQHLKQLNELAK